MIKRNRCAATNRSEVKPADISQMLYKMLAEVCDDPRFCLFRVLVFILSKMMA